MGKGFKGLKRLGALMFGLVVFSLAIISPIDVYAVAYQPLTSAGDDVVEKATWRFADGLVKYDPEVNFDVRTRDILRDEADMKNIGAKYHLVLEKGYKWSGSDTVYDIHFNITVKYVEDSENEKIGKESTASATDIKVDFKDKKATQTGTSVPNHIPKAGYPRIKYITFSGAYGEISGNKGCKYTMEVEMWLQNGTAVVSATEVPFILGSVWNGDNEINEIYSTEKLFTDIIFTNTTDKLIYLDGTETGYNNAKGYYNGKNTYNRPYHYLNGFGYTDDNKVKLTYHQKGNGNLELRVGYRAYSIEYFADNPPTITQLPELEMVPTPDSSNPRSPQDVANNIQADNPNVITQLKLTGVYYGENTPETRINPGDSSGPVDYVILKNGTKIYVGSEIKPYQIPLIQMDKNVEITVYTTNTPVKLNYHLDKEIASPKLSGHDYTNSINLTENYATTDDTSNGSYKKGDVVTGTDGKKYRLVGWYTDTTYTTEFRFGNTLPNDTDIFAKWEEVIEDSKPSSTPEDSSTDSDTPSTGEPIKVEFVTPIGNPPPTQIKHVGDKADDPGAPIDPATLKPGTIIDGHRFEGWYLDKGFTMPYNFDTKLPHSIVLYAKWVRVSPKTGDTTIPPVYYVFGALALAGVGALATKSRELRK